MINIIWQDHGIKKEDREELLNQRGVCLWFTGLSGSGKSTLAIELQKTLMKEGKLVYILDGDNIRHGLNVDLGFSAKDREENIRRVGEVSKLFVDAGLICITTLISPYRKERDKVRDNIGKDFIEIFVRCALEECEKRDVKGLYKKAKSGEIKDFTGLDAPYEEPLNPEIIIDTSAKNVKDCVKAIYHYLKEMGAM